MKSPNDIIYRDMEAGDVRGVCEICDDVWYCGGPDGITDPVLAFVASEQLTYHYLADSTYSRVAVDSDGVCVGALMANVAGEPLNEYSARFSELEAECDRKLLTDERAALMSNFYVEMYRNCDAMKEKHIGEYGSELLLFYVRKGCQGLGIGKRLLSDYRDHLKSKGIEGTFLFTNNFCNIGFYDHSGWICIEHLTSMINGQRFDGYLYGKRISSMD